MERTKILIVNYFVGDEYNSIGKIQRWIDNVIKNLLIDCDRNIVIYTDNINAIYKYNNKYKEIKFENIQEKLDRYYLLSIKYQLIFNAFLKYRDDYQYICFAQSNIMLLDKIYLKNLINNKYQIQLLLHPNYEYTKDSFLNLYGDNVSSCVNILDYIDDFDCNWKYYQSGLSMYTPEILLWIYNEINNRMLLDFYNHKFVKWHDETYLNFIINIVLKDKSIINSKSYSDKFSFFNKQKKEYIIL